MIIPVVMSAFYCPEVDFDVLDDIRREDARKAQQRKNARKQKARELTRLRELEINRKKGVSQCQ